MAEAKFVPLPTPEELAAEYVERMAGPRVRAPNPAKPGDTGPDYDPNLERPALVGHAVPEAPGDLTRRVTEEGGSGLLDYARRLFGTDPEKAMTERMKAGERLAGGYERTAGRLRTAGKEMRQLESDQARERKAAEPATLKLPAAPSTAARAFLQPGESVLSQLQAAISAVGLIGTGLAGLKGGGYAIAAVSALKGAAEGWQAGDADRVKRSLEQWHVQSDKLLAEHRAARERFEDLLTDQRRTMEERLREVQLLAQVGGQEALAEAARIGKWDAIIKYGEDQRKLGVQLWGIQRQIEQYRSTAERKERFHQDAMARQEKAAADLERQRTFSRGQTEERTRLMEGVAVLKAVQPLMSTPIYIGEIHRARQALQDLHTRGLLSRDPMAWSKLAARLRQSLQPNDPDLGFVRFIETPLGVGLWDRQIHDEKGSRALAAYKAQTGEYLSLGTYASASRLLDEMESSLLNRFKIQSGVLKSVPGAMDLLDRIERAIPTEE